jgi:hypothetical protein
VIADVAANVLDGLLVDQVAADLRRLAAINSFFVENPTTGTMRSPRAYRISRGHAPYKPIAYALVAPRRRGEIGRLADAVFAGGRRLTTTATARSTACSSTAASRPGCTRTMTSRS